jgi:glyoxylase-like metal-dependent hydrolase (beta-lactamase superfamily II)
MIKVSSHGQVTRFDLGRNIFGRCFYWTAAYHINGVMIDTGCAFSAPELVTAVARLPVSKIVNTHSHEDHVGGNSPLREAHPSIEIMAHRLALNVLSDPGSERMHPYRRILWGRPQPSTAREVSDGATIDAGDLKLEVVTTPGHSADHICLFERRNGWLFTGDLLIGGYDRALREGSEIWQIIASLRKVAALRPTVVFPRCARVPEDPTSALLDKARYLELLGERVLEQRRRGRNVRQIIRAVCGPPMAAELLTLGNFARRHLVCSYLSRPQA